MMVIMDTNGRKLVEPTGVVSSLNTLYTLCMLLNTLLNAVVDAMTSSKDVTKQAGFAVQRCSHLAILCNVELVVVRAAQHADASKATANLKALRAQDIEECETSIALG